MYARFGTFLVAAALMAAGPATAQESARASSLGASSVSARSVSARVDGCVRYVGQQAMVVSCARAEPRLAADHGTSYDGQGNPVDRHHNVIATSGGRTPAREVFASERAVR